MLNGAEKLPRSLLMEYRKSKSHHAEGSRQKEREYNARYREEHREEINTKRREQQRKMKLAMEYCAKMGIDLKEAGSEGRC